MNIKTDWVMCVHDKRVVDCKPCYDMTQVAVDPWREMVRTLRARVAELEAERDARPSVEFMEAAKALRDLVDSAEAVPWRSERGRLRDAKQWTVFYCAVAKWEREKGGTETTPCATTSTPENHEPQGT